MAELRLVDESTQFPQPRLLRTAKGSCIAGVSQISGEHSPRRIPGVTFRRPAEEIFSKVEAD